MSLLSIIQSVAIEMGLKSPSQVVGSTDRQILQLLEIARSEGKDLASRYHWSVMTKECTFSMVATLNQGAINGTVVTDSDFDYLLNETMWNRTTSLPIIGPKNAESWEAMQSFTAAGGPFQEYRIQGGDLYIDPAPTAGHTLAFIYKSTWWCESSGGSGQSTWAADTDVGLLNEEIMRLGIKWRWLKTKGLEYQEDFASYERQVQNAMARDGSKPRLRSDGGPYRSVPGIVVPSGNWPL